MYIMHITVIICNMPNICGAFPVLGPDMFRCKNDSTPHADILSAVLRRY